MIILNINFFYCRKWLTALYQLLHKNIYDFRELISSKQVRLQYRVILSIVHNPLSANKSVDHVTKVKNEPLPTIKVHLNIKSNPMICFISSQCSINFTLKISALNWSKPMINRKHHEQSVCEDQGKRGLFGKYHG